MEYGSPAVEGEKSTGESCGLYSKACKTPVSEGAPVGLEAEIAVLCDTEWSLSSKIVVNLSVTAEMFCHGSDTWLSVGWSMSVSDDA